MDELFFYINKDELAQKECEQICVSIDDNNEDDFLAYITREKPELRNVLINKFQNTIVKYLDYYKSNDMYDISNIPSTFMIVKINAIKMLKHEYNEKYKNFVKDKNNLNYSVILTLPLNSDLTIIINDKEYVVSKGDVAIFPNVWPYIYNEKITTSVEYVYLLKICTENQW
jgi:hypothetical protein